MILTLNYFKINVCIYIALVFQYYTHTFFILEWGGNDELCSNYNWTYRYAFVLNFLGLQQKSSKLKLKFIFSLSMILFYFKKSKIALLKNIDFSFLFILFYLFPFFFYQICFHFSSIVNLQTLTYLNYESLKSLNASKYNINHDSFMNFSEHVVHLDEL